MRLDLWRRGKTPLRSGGRRARPWWIVSFSLGGLLVAITVAGLVGLAINRNLLQITERALEQDVKLEDLGDDLRVAVLDVRHFYRNLLFHGVTADGLTRFQDAYSLLLTKIDALEALEIDDPGVPQAAALRTMAEEFYTAVWPSLGQADVDPAAVAATGNEGLDRLARLERAAETVDRLGELRAAAALVGVEEAAADARLVLLSVLGGGILIGAALVYATVRVVGEVRRLYEAQQEAATQLSAALQAKNDFIADASHELRTPLTVLRGNAEAGLAMDSTCVHRAVLEDIVAEAARMTRLVEDLLFLARSDAASVPLEIEPVAAESLIAELAGRAEVLIQERGARLVTSLSGRGMLSVDVARIEQAVMILIDNAAKYSPPNGLITLASYDRQGELIIEVVDQGPGIPASDLARIFDRFYRVDRARSRAMGSAGLGLAIARTIVETHGGRITAQSRVGEGTTMRIALPLHAAATPPRPATARPGRATRADRVPTTPTGQTTATGPPGDPPATSRRAGQATVSVVPSPRDGGAQG